MHTLGGHAFVRIRDSGIGIAPESLPHIFDLFMQADATSPRSRSGLGIGLALVRTLVELHGGNVTAVSAGPGQGSEFTVRLPEDK
jgi:signal transduction histidine kinase